MTTTSEDSGFGIDEIMRRLPHRYPFLLVDRVVECVSGQHIVARKNVTANEQFFLGHFPGRPVMPGVMILEALAQAAGILCFVTADIYPDENIKLYFAGIDGVRFRRPLVLRATLQRRIRTIWKFAVAATVDGHEVCTAEMLVTPG